MQNCKTVIRAVFICLAGVFILVQMSWAAPPDSDDWALLVWGPAAGQLTCYPVIPGDYDFNGEVNIADITVLGIHLGESGPEGAWPHPKDHYIDRDHNGVINISDLTEIGRNYGRNCLGGFTLYRNDGSLEQLGQFDFDPAQRTADGMSFAHLELGQAAGRGFSVEPVDSAGNTGSLSAAIQRFPPGLGPISTSDSITFPSYDVDTGRLRWHYANRGDCNQDGMVTWDLWAEGPAGDTQIMGEKLGAVFDPVEAWYEAISCVDADGNGEVNYSDLTPLGANYGCMVQGYHIYGADTEPIDGSAVDQVLLGEVAFTESRGDPAYYRRWFELELGSPAPARYIWVIPYVETLEGTPSAVLDTVTHNWNPNLGVYVIFYE